jgi:gliding motility-associated-like protein
MTIFDRWGKQIYSSTSINAGWDGRVKGRDSDIGVYQYIIKVKFRDNKVETFTGDFTLIR